MLGGPLGRKDCAGRDAGWDVRNWLGSWAGMLGGRWESGKIGRIVGRSGTGGRFLGRKLEEMVIFGTEAGRKGTVVHGGHGGGRNTGRK